MRQDEYEYAEKVGEMLRKERGYRDGEAMCLKLISEGRINASGHPSYGVRIINEILDGKSVAPWGW